MLSEMRKELLRKNRDRIKAFVMDAEDEESDCLYQYPDGTICAASACLTDAEREIAAQHCNSNGVLGIHFARHLPEIDQDDLDVMGDMQNLHDEYVDEDIHWRKRDSELLQELKDLIDSILS